MKRITILLAPLALTSLVTAASFDPHQIRRALDESGDDKGVYGQIAMFVVGYRDHWTDDLMTDAWGVGLMQEFEKGYGECQERKHFNANIILANIKADDDDEITYGSWWAKYARQCQPMNDVWVKINRRIELHLNEDHLETYKKD